jgi:hypothetical protein
MIFRSLALRSPDADAEAAALVGKLTDVLSRTAADLGVRYEYVGVDDSVHVWEEVPDRESTVRFEDSLPTGRFMTVGALEPEKCERVAQAIAPAFSLWTLSELVEKARTCPESDPHWIGRMANVAAGPFDPQVVAVIEQRLSDGGTEIRRAAADAAGVLLWPELLPSMRAVMEHERDYAVRQVFNIVIPILEKKANR